MGRLHQACLPLALLGVGLLALACSDKGQGPLEEELAAQAAKQYYDDLIYGREEEWLDGHRGAKAMSPEYRQQLLENARMFLEQQRKAHGGISDVALGKCKGQVFDGSPIAILTLCYADATQETVAVPMVLEDGEWRMR